MLVITAADVNWLRRILDANLFEYVLKYKGSVIMVSNGEKCVSLGSSVKRRAKSKIVSYFKSVDWPTIVPASRMPRGGDPEEEFAALEKELG